MKIQPFYSTRDFVQLVKRFPDAQICAYSQFLGVIPAEICDIFPAAHHLSSAAAGTLHQAKDYPTFIESLDSFLAYNTFGDITIVADDFMHDLIYNNSYKDKLNAKVLDYKEGIVCEL